MSVVNLKRKAAQQPDEISLFSHEPYAALARRHAELSAERQQLIADIKLAASAVQHAAPPPPDIARAARIAELLGEEPPPPPPPTVRDRLTELQGRLADVEDALRELGSRMAVARIEASNAVCAKLTDRHRRLVLDLAEALRRAYEAHANYEAFADELRRANVAWASLRPADAADLFGPAGSSSSKLAQWFRQASRDHGVEVPRGMR